MVTEILFRQQSQRTTLETKGLYANIYDGDDFRIEKILHSSSNNYEGEVIRLIRQNDIGEVG